MAILEVEHINKKFDRTEVLKDISFSLEQGQVLSIIGSSGSGKTTLLRCLNFLETPDVGIIRVNGETLFDAGNEMTKQENEIRKKRLHFGLVFQSFNLFPQYTALENVMLAKELLAKAQPDYKKNKKKIHSEIEKLGRKLLTQMGLFLGGAIYRIPVLIDGFISSVAALCAVRLAPLAGKYLFASHCSKEPGGKRVLDALGMSAMIVCDLSLGEGSGAVAAVPLLEMGLDVYRKMSTFEEIQVEQYQELK